MDTRKQPSLYASCTNHQNVEIGILDTKTAILHLAIVGTGLYVRVESLDFTLVGTWLIWLVLLRMNIVILDTYTIDTNDP